MQNLISSKTARFILMVKTKLNAYLLSEHCSDHCSNSDKKTKPIIPAAACYSRLHNEACSRTGKTQSSSDGDTHRWDRQLQAQGDPADYQSNYTKQAHPGEMRGEKFNHL